jgi:class 3 adenylate cyclase
MTDEAHADFGRLIAALAAADDEAAQGEIRKSIWDRFGTSGATFISDMANFSSTSRSLGICHFLKLIHRAREIVAPIVHDNSGVLLKYDADNCYACFEDPGMAVQASLDINSALFDANQQRDIDEHIYVSVGIDYGDFLLVGDSEFFGDPVNTASKLGEDLAIKGETLVTERALHRTSVSLDENTERMVARISDIEIAYVRIPMTQAIRRTSG